MKIVFWGTPEYAAQNLINIVNAGNNVIAVVTQPDRKRGRGKNLSPSPVKKAALDLDIPVLVSQSISKDQITKDLLISLKADIYIVVAFGQILPREILNQPKMGCWNSHASLLPAWRGAAPIQWSILNGDLKTGVCIMSMEEGLDTGPVIEQEETVIDDLDNLETLTNRLSNISSKLLIKSLNRIKTTEKYNQSSRLKQLNAIDQSELSPIPSYARQIIKEDYLIDWHKMRYEIINQIKALYPNAYTLYKGKRIKIIEAINIDDHDFFLENKSLLTEKRDQLLPGEIIMIGKEIGIIVMTQDFPIQIKKTQLEGKKPTDSFTLTLQTNISIKNIFEC